MRLGSFLALLLLLSVAFADSPADTLVLPCYADDLETLDPGGAYNILASQVIDNIYEGLYSYKGGAVDKYEPILATDYRVSKDGLEYTFSLRQGVSFHSVEVA